MRRTNNYKHLEKDGFVKRINDFGFPFYIKQYDNFITKLFSCYMRNKNGTLRPIIIVRFYDKNGNHISRFENIKWLESIELFGNFLVQHLNENCTKEELIDNEYTEIFDGYAKNLKKGLGVYLSLKDEQYVEIMRCWKYLVKTDNHFSLDTIKQLVDMCEQDYRNYKTSN